jgi:chemotaxis protein methyltransferase CheR
VKDEDCVRFLQWVLPQLKMRWPGFRKVRKQVCKRLQRRIIELELADVDAYRQYLQNHAAEWRDVDFLCRITVSRFYRDKTVLQHLQAEVLPGLAGAALNAGDGLLRAWSAGCAMGEEAYTVLLIWDMALRDDFPGLDIDVIGSDIDNELLDRARRGCYESSSIKALPEQWLNSVFVKHKNEYCLDARLRNKVRFISQDIRNKTIEGSFHIIFCRNMAFTYFEHTLQLEVLQYLHANLVDGGTLIIGGHESLPGGFCGFEQWSKQRAIYRKI